jgi:hypothetical protein
METVTGRYAFADAPGELPAREVARANQLCAQPNSLRTLLPGCPEDLADLIDRALSKDKEKRPGSTEFLAGLRAEYQKLFGAAHTQTSETQNEDSSSEPVPASVVPSSATVAQPPLETSVVRVIPNLWTERLGVDYVAQNPSAAANPGPPVVRTLKMYRPAEEDLEAARRAKAATRDASAARLAVALRDKTGDTTSGGRSATLPPVPTASTAPDVLAAAPVSNLLLQPSDLSPVPHRAPATAPAQPMPAHHDLSDAARVSLELANRPTLRWKRLGPVRATVSSTTPAPILQRVSDAAWESARFPIWVGPVLGVTLVLGCFGGYRAVRGHAHRTSLVDGQSVTSSATAPPISTTTVREIAPPRPAETATPVASTTATPTAALTVPSAAAPAAMSAPTPMVTITATPAASSAPTPTVTTPATPIPTSSTSRAPTRGKAVKPKPSTLELFEPDPFFMRKKPEPTSLPAPKVKF